MNPILIARLLICAVLLTPVALRADESPANAEQSPSSRTIGPASLKATIGDITIRIDGPKLWTLSRIEVGGTVLGVEESAYGTAINIRGVGFLGSAHRLDVPGRPGEVEAEEVTRLRFFVDDRPLEMTSETMHVTGISLRMERESKIRSFSLQSTLLVRDDRLRETVRIRSDQAVDLKVLYPCMYAWTPSASAYLFGNDDGSQTAGEFRSKPSTTPDYITKTSVRWGAVYDPRSGRGSVSVIVAAPKGQDASFLLADAPEVYRKLYLVSFADSQVPKGFDGTYSVVTGFFKAPVEEWKGEATKRAGELIESCGEPD